MVAEISASSRASSPATVSTSPASAVGSSMVRSRPAEKLGPAPRTTTTRVSSGSEAPSSASARHMAGVWALRTSGRFSVMEATGPACWWSRPTAARDSGVMGPESRSQASDTRSA